MNSITQFLSEILKGGAEEINLLHALIAIFVAYFGGVLSSLTPCVYPMIPITVSVVGGMDSQKRPWKEMLLRGGAYVLGMTLVYSILGVIAGVSGKVFGSFTNTSGWYLTLGTVMSLAALVMLDVIPFDPAVWMETLKRKFHHQKPTHHASPQTQKEMTLMGAFVLGASSGFIAAPCTTPVLTSILAYIANTQSVVLGFLLMFSFSLGLGTLLLAVAAFAGVLRVLPKSGHWLKTIKTVSGLILLAFAEYLIYRAGNFGGP